MLSLKKEWRAVSENNPVKKLADYLDMETKFGQSDERTIHVVQQRREAVDINSSVMLDHCLNAETLQQRIVGISKQRDELLRMEIELKAKVMAKSDIANIQSSFETRLKDKEATVEKLQKELHERENSLRELDRRMEEKERELHAVKLDNEKAWAKESILREQNMELATFRREREHSEAERAHQIQQIHDLKDLIQEKERQIIELQELRRADQEAIYLKDEQLKVWVSRAQEMDALQSNAAHSLQTELQERTEQYYQLWLGCQRQFAEMERFHMHTIQQLQMELAEARARNGGHPDTLVSRAHEKDIPKFGQSGESQLDMNGSDVRQPSSFEHHISSFPPNFTDSNHANRAAVPSSFVAMPTYIPTGQVAALHPFVVPQQAMPPTVPIHDPQAQVVQVRPAPVISPFPQWQNHQAVPGGTQFAVEEDQPGLSAADSSHTTTDTDINYGVSANGNSYNSEQVHVHANQTADNSETVARSSTGVAQVPVSFNGDFAGSASAEQISEQLSSHFIGSLRLKPLKLKSETEDHGETNEGQRGHVSSDGSAPETEPPLEPVNHRPTEDGTVPALPEEDLSMKQTGVMEPVVKEPETILLDERSLLACIVRTIPVGGCIRINSTLQNRLGKILAPLRWHDYRKSYGKLEEFVGRHQELFRIDGDNIQLREGAQEMVAAKAAIAKVAAAATLPARSTTYHPSVAVTPMAQHNRLKKLPNGIIGSNNSERSMSSVKILSKPKDAGDRNGPSAQA